uniref:Uncharacterized protein n=1 Tax=Arundo donax TaxID=35708 RepID=A0A0A9AQ73_ARUDO
MRHINRWGKKSEPSLLHNLGCKDIPNRVALVTQLGSTS